MVHHSPALVRHPTAVGPDARRVTGRPTAVDIPRPPRPAPSGAGPERAGARPWTGGRPPFLVYWNYCP